MTTSILKNVESWSWFGSQPGSRKTWTSPRTDRTRAFSQPYRKITSWCKEEKMYYLSALQIIANGLKFINWLYPFYFEKVNKVKKTKWAIEFQAAGFFKANWKLMRWLRKKWWKGGRRGLQYFIWVSKAVNSFYSAEWSRGIAPTHSPPPEHLHTYQGLFERQSGSPSDPFSDTFLSRPLHTSGPSGLVPAEDPTSIVSLLFPLLLCWTCMRENKLE